MISNNIDNLVSVIIPVYNASSFIKESIESALNQTYNNIEIIIINDLSTDNSEQIITNYLSKHNNIIYIKHNVNQGAAVARNTALKVAKGRYIAFLDSDDIWLPNKIESQILFMTAQDCAISFTAIDFINEKSVKIKGLRNIKDIVSYNFLLKNTVIATSTVVIDRKKTGLFEMPLLRSGQDYATWLMLLRNGVNAYGINHVFVHYRKTSNSLSSNKIKSIMQIWYIQRNYEKISIIRVIYNISHFIFNAFLKHFF